MGSELDMSKCPKTVFLHRFPMTPLFFNFGPQERCFAPRWGPCAPCTGRGAKHPSIQIALALEHVSCDQKSLKNRKNATFSKIVQESLASLKITQEHSPSTQDVPGTRFEAFWDFSFLAIFRPKMSRSGTSEQNSQP